MFAGNRWSFDRFVSYQDMLDRIREQHPLERLEDGPNDPSKVRCGPESRWAGAGAGAGRTAVRAMVVAWVALSDPNGLPSPLQSASSPLLAGTRRGACPGMQARWALSPR